MTTVANRFSALREHLVRVGEDLFVSAIVAAIVSAGALVWFEGRLENSKTRVEMLIASEEKFDDAHNAVLSEFGIYAHKLLDDRKADAGQREKILAAVIQAQSQLLKLRQQLPSQNDGAITRYATDLNRFSDSVRVVSKPDQLGPAYDNVQLLLADRDDVVSSVKGNLHITAF